MDQRFVVVSESAPQLKAMDSESARKFLREYESYEFRVGDGEAVIPMRRCLEREIIDLLLTLTEDEIIVVPRAVEPPAPVAVAAAAQPVVNEEEEINSEDDDEEVGSEATVPDAPRAMVRLSNEHIIEMLIVILGPINEANAGAIFEKLTMPKDVVAFENLIGAMHYLRDWKIAERWCARQQLKQAYLVEQFIKGVYPKKLRAVLKMHGFRRLQQVKDRFLVEYKASVKARNTLCTTGGIGDDANSASASGKGGSGKPKSSEPVPEVVKPKTKDAGTADQDGKTKTESGKTGMSGKTCYNCHQAGHIRPNCPLLNPQASQQKKPPKLGMMHGGVETNSKSKVLTMMVDVRGVDYTEAPYSMIAEMDTCSEVNLVGSSWVPMLWIAGALPEKIEPFTVGWVTSDATITCVHRIQLEVRLSLTAMVEKLWFYVAPPHVVLDGLVLGWPQIERLGWLPHLQDVRKIQEKASHLDAGSSYTRDENMTFSDMDGQTVETDDLLWPDNGESGVSEGTLELPIIGEGLNQQQKLEVEALLQEFADVFSPELVPGGALVEPMHINTRPEWEPPSVAPPRKYAPAVQAAIEKELEEQLALGIVEPSEASSGAPVLMVRKPSSPSGYRFCIDFSEFNKHVITESYPLPTIQTILDSMAGAAFFAKFDLRSGYWQFPVAVEDRYKVAFQVLNRVFQYCSVPMGHVQSSFHVQKQMILLFRKLVGSGVYVYLDDIAVYAKTFEEFLLLLRQVLTIMKEHRLRCKASKCAIGMPELPILGSVVSKGGIRMSQERISAILAVPFPTTARALRRYLGMVNFMRRHIPNLSTLTKPLSTWVNEPPSAWPRKEMRESYDQTQVAVSNQLQLAHLDYNKAVVLSADASVLGVGGTLSNRYIDEDGETVTDIVACASHAFTTAESKWKTIEQEAFASVWIILFFRAVLWGHPFLLETDHRNLLYIHGGTSPKVTRWAMVLQNFAHTVRHVPGSTFSVPDALSRAPCGQSDGEAVTLADLTSASPIPQFRAMRAVVDVDRQREIFDACHNSTQGHNGIHRTVREIRELGYDWPRMTRDITGWIQECGICQKIRADTPDVKAIPSPIGAFCIFEELSIDFIGPLPRDEVGNAFIFNAACSSIRYCELFAVEAETAIIAAHCLLSVTCRYGCFRRIRSDRGSHFVNEVIEEFLRLFQIQSVVTLAYRPQANGLIERNGGEVMRHLRAITVDKNLRPLWSVVLPMVMRIINKSYKQSIGATPHRLMHWAPTDLDRGMFDPFGMELPIPPLQTEYVTALEKAYGEILDATSLHILHEQEMVAARYVGTIPTEFPPGSFVLVSYTSRAPSKLHCRWQGPFEVMSRERNNVIVRDLTSDNRHEFDVSRLRVFLVSPTCDPKVLAAADLGELEVSEVLDHRGSVRQRAELQFLLRWSDGEETWEPWEQVKKLSLIDQYILAHPDAKLNSLLHAKPKK